MSYRKTVFECAAYRTLEQWNSLSSGFHAFKPGDTIAIPFKTHRGDYLRSIFKFGDDMSYALQYSECPIEAKKRCEERGRDLYWLTKQSVSISSGRKTQKTHTEAAFGDIVQYAGQLFKIVPQLNENAGLEWVGTAKGGVVQSQEEESA